MVFIEGDFHLYEVQHYIVPRHLQSSRLATQGEKTLIECVKRFHILEAFKLELQLQDFAVQQLEQ